MSRLLRHQPRIVYACIIYIVICNVYICIYIYVYVYVYIYIYIYIYHVHILGASTRQSTLPRVVGLPLHGRPCRAHLKLRPVCSKTKSGKMGPDPGSLKLLKGILRLCQAMLLGFEPLDVKLYGLYLWELNAGTGLRSSQASTLRSLRLWSKLLPAWADLLTDYTVSCDTPLSTAFSRLFPP